jgi:hypothetical protein
VAGQQVQQFDRYRRRLLGGVPYPLSATLKLKGRANRSAQRARPAFAMCPTGTRAAAPPVAAAPSKVAIGHRRVPARVRFRRHGCATTGDDVGVGGLPNQRLPKRRFPKRRLPAPRCSQCERVMRADGMRARHTVQPANQVQLRNPRVRLETAASVAYLSATAARGWQSPGAASRVADSTLLRTARGRGRCGAGEKGSPDARQTRRRTCLLTLRFSGEPRMTSKRSTW